MTFAAAETGMLVWQRPSVLRPNYILIKSGRGLGSLRIEKLFSRHAEAEFRGTRWQLDRTGLLKPRISIRKADSDVPFAVFKTGWAGTGEVTLASGAIHQWRHLDFFASRWAFRNKAGELLVEYRRQGFFLRKRLSVLVHAAVEEEAGALILLGFYLRVLRRKRILALSALRAFTAT